MRWAKLVTLAPALLALVSAPTAAAPFHSAQMRDFVADICLPGPQGDAHG